MEHLPQPSKGWYQRNRNIVKEVERHGPTIKIGVSWQDSDCPFICHALVDSGAHSNFIPQRMVEALGIPCYALLRPKVIVVGDERNVSVTHFADVIVKIKDIEYRSSFAVFPTEEIIIGLFFQQKHFLSLKYNSRLFKLCTDNSHSKNYAKIRTRHTIWAVAKAQQVPQESLRSMRFADTEDLEQTLELSRKQFLKGENEFLVRKTITIPPGTESRVNVISTSGYNNEVFITNSRSAPHGPVVKNQLGPANTDFVYVTNFNRFPLRVPQGSSIAEGHLVKSITPWTVRSCGTQVLEMTPDPEVLISEPSQVEQLKNYLSHYYQNIVCHDAVKMLKRNKNPCNYPMFFDDDDWFCKKLMKQTMDDRLPDYVVPQNRSHPNKRSNITRPEFDFSCFIIGRDGMDEKQRAATMDMIWEHREMFIYSKKDLGAVDRSKLPKVDIKTRGEKPIKSHPYRRSPKDRKVIEDLVQEMLEAGIIRPSESPYSSPVVVVSKKDGGQRMCVDYRKLNADTIKDNYPLPLVADALDTCAGSKWFSSVDLFSGYHLLPMDEESIPKTAFISHCGLFEYLVLPFGLTSAPAKFQKLMDRILGSLKWTSCFVYLDDVVVFARDFAEHQVRLEKVLQALDSVNLKLNPKKCMFGFRSLEYLGHIISEDGIRPSEGKVEKIRSMKPPKNVKQLRQFLGLVGYFRSFVENFSKIANPLYKLLKADEKFIFGPQQLAAFEQLKNSLCCSPVRTFFNDSAVHEVHTDASGLGLGAVLLQQEFDELGNEVWKVVQYWARGLKPAEKNYQATELEMLAVVEALEAFRPYLHGLSFTIVTDHQALRALEGGELCSKPRANRRLAKWRLLIEDFDYKIRYKKGKTHHVPDALSRYSPAVSEGKEPDEDRMFLSAVRGGSPIIEEQLSSIKDLQLADTFCQHIIEKLNQPETRGNKSTKRRYVLLEGILYRKWSTSRGSHFCVVVPEVLKQKILKETHDGQMGVHPGQTRTITLLRSKYWWPLLKRDAIDYVRKCTHCLLKKPTHWGKPKPKPVIDSFSPKDTIHPFKWLSIDLIDLKDHPTFHKNKYIVVVVDYLTKFLITGTLKDLTASSLRDWFFKAVVLFCSAPEVLISDNGSNLKSELFKEFCKESKIQRRYVAPYRASSNGQVERMNFLIKEALSSFVSKTHQNWDHYLQTVTFSLNCQISSVTGMSPFKAVFGFNPRMTFDNEHGVPSIEYVKGDDRIQDWKELFSRVERAGEKLKKRKVRNYLPIFEVGEKVAIFDHRLKIGKVKGFVNFFKGPYIVLERLNEDMTYVVSPLDDCGTKITVHVSEMKRWYPEEEAITDPLSADTEEQQDEAEEIILPDYLHDQRQEAAAEEEPQQRKRGRSKEKAAPRHGMTTRSRSRPGQEIEGSTVPQDRDQVALQLCLCQADK